MPKALHIFEANEIQKYIFTDTLLNNICLVLDRLVHTQYPKITNIWVEGAFASGRTYFLKYIYFCLNPATREEAFTHIIEYVRNLEEKGSSNNLYFTLAEILYIRNALNSHTFDVCLGPYFPGYPGVKNFAEDVANFYHHTLGFHAFNYNYVRNIEWPLSRLGLLEEFKRRFSEEYEIEYSHENIDAALQLEASEIITLVNQVAPSIEITLHDLFRKSHNSEIAAYILKELVEYFKTKGNNHKVIFMIDMYDPLTANECSQLQELTYSVAGEFKDKVWFLFTGRLEYSNTECTDAMNKIKDHNSDSIRLRIENPIEFDFLK